MAECRRQFVDTSAGIRPVFIMVNVSVQFADCFNTPQTEVTMSCVSDRYRHFPCLAENLEDTVKLNVVKIVKL